MVGDLLLFFRKNFCAYYCFDCVWNLEKGKSDEGREEF